MSRAPICAILVLPVMLAVPAGFQGGGQAETPRLLRRLDAGGDGFFEVADAAFRGRDLVVLTRPEPAVHLFTGATYRSWGRKGAGPAELTNPVDIAWAGSHILVRDAGLGKLASFDATGRLVATRRVPAGDGVPVRLQVAGSDTVLGFVRPGASHATVIRVGGAHQDTVLRYATEERTVTLTAPGAPTLTLTAPFAPQQHWALLRDGTLAFWDGAAAHLELRDRRGRVTARLPLPAERFPVTDADRATWIARAIPKLPGRGDVFAPLRPRVVQQVRFPDRLPAVLSLVADPEGGVWVLRSTRVQGQRWTRLQRGRRPENVQLPRGRSLLAISSGEVAVLAQDEDDLQVVEIYEKPGSRSR